MSVSEIEALLKSKPDAKTDLRLVNILALAKVIAVERQKIYPF